MKQAQKAGSFTNTYLGPSITTTGGPSITTTARVAVDREAMSSASMDVNINNSAVAAAQPQPDELARGSHTVGRKADDLSPRPHANSFEMV
jgi:hypothetical protein